MIEFVLLKNPPEVATKTGVTISFPAVPSGEGGTLRFSDAEVTYRTFDYGKPVTNLLGYPHILKLTSTGLVQIPLPTAETLRSQMIEKDETAKRLINHQLKSAEAGNRSSQYDVGLRYLKGDGLPQDRLAAIRWLTKAAEQGHQQAKEKLESIQSADR